MTSSCLVAASLVLSVTAADRGGIRPVGDNGQALNLNFEDGTINGWTAQGNAFEKQPIEGDVVKARRADMTSDHEGQYWIGSFERAGDPSQGTLTSPIFKVTHPYATFLVGGGPHESTRVELVSAADNKILFKTSGLEAENMRPILADLQAYKGKDIFIRVVDQHTGHWGHVNFDDFRFHAEKPTFANLIDPAKAVADAPPPMDSVKFDGLPALEAAAAISAPPGFSTRLFAGEPDVQQPIAFALDDRGRLWVAEGFTYPRRAPEGQGKDRILILEDTNGDHAFDKRTIFAEGLNLVSGMEVGFGGVWVGAAPYLMFIPDRNGDDKPDSEPQILLDGWGAHDTHETLNTFNWGPDGWLYGCHGIFTHSNVGKPGASDPERAKINGGIWRYHPLKHAFEVFAEGTSNPWGIDFDDHGQAFIEACVIPHFFHIIQGARYERQAGQHFNPHIYEDIKTHGDHVHYAGNKGPHAGNSRSDSAGGGHAHAGLLIYLGDSWPQEYRNSIFMNNIHGQRLNMDYGERKGSGFVGKHGKDFLFFNDKWSQVLNMITDQDGSMYMLDWYDKNQCHHNNPDGHDRSNGRVFKTIYNNQSVTKIDLQKKSSAELVQLQLHKNDFYVRHARRILQERGPNPEVHSALRELVKSQTEETRKLRALWALHVTGGLREEDVLTFLQDKSEYVRGWTLQLAAETKKVNQPVLARMAQLATLDPSPVVRLYLASALQRIPAAQRWDTLAALVARAEDTNDHNLPLLYWYAAEESVASDPKRGLKLLSQAKIPKLRQFIARRIASTEKAFVQN